MDYEVIQSKKKSKIHSLKTLKGRFLPTQEQKDQIQLMMEQSRWYYNFLISVIKDRYKDLKYVESAFRTMKTVHLEVRPYYVRKETYRYSNKISFFFFII